MPVPLLGVSLINLSLRAFTKFGVVYRKWSIKGEIS